MTLSITNQYRLLIWLLLIGTIATTSHIFTVGLSGLWAAGFAISLLVAGWFYGKYMEREKEKTDV